jgi:hypothetical protein
MAGPISVHPFENRAPSSAFKKPLVRSISDAAPSKSLTTVHFSSVSAPLLNVVAQRVRCGHEAAHDFHFRLAITNEKNRYGLCECGLKAKVID